MDKTAYPYIPNSVRSVKDQMLKECGAESIEDLYAEIPKHLRLKRKLNLPRAYFSEYALRRHVEGILSKNVSCKNCVSFLGAGTWQHYVPAICDEINSRAEFLTAYSGRQYADHGKWQALFEYASMLCELVGMEATSLPTYDWGQAAGTSLLMASRITGRKEVLLAGTVSKDRLLQIKNYLRPKVNVVLVDYDTGTGKLMVEDLKKKISSRIAAVYFENPSYLGLIETGAEEIVKTAHAYGALCVVGVDPISLGVLAPPSQYGADIVCGDLQPLGIHMNYGGGLAGFIATRDEPEFVAEFPGQIFGITSTEVEGEYGFGQVFWERTSLASREGGREYTGTSAGLWGITAGVYLALMGPSGMREIGEIIMQRSSYTIKLLSEIEGIEILFKDSIYFKEFVVNFDKSGIDVKSLNKALLSYKIFGGKDLFREFPELGNSALYCVTELHTKEDIDRLASGLQKITRNKVGGQCGKG
ncbi:MAG: aminomethyl-transferring glycine dehydrogenase subunit GcvPA [Bacillota bacterium]